MQFSTRKKRAPQPRPIPPLRDMKPRHTPRPKRSVPRPRRRQGGGTIKVYQIHCKACGKRYELSWSGEVKFCSFCQSDQIDKALRDRNETPAERAERNLRMNAHLLDFAAQFIGGIVGFKVPPLGTAVSNDHKPSDLEQELMKEGYRKLATKYHPDRGGDTEKMKELNRLKEKLNL